MTNSLTNPLAQYIAKNGLAIIEDEKRFESVIRDLYNNDERDRNLLIRSIELKIPQEILSNQKRSEFNLSLNKIVVHLCDAHGLEKNNAEWVVETWSEALSPKEISIDLGNGIRLELVLIPAGSFKVEFFTTKTGQGYFKEQGEITFKKFFYMGKFAITQEQWETYSKENVSKFIGNNLPITNISWHDSLKFIQKLNAISDGGFRLPIRAEWEYACRAGSISLYSFGDQITPNDANYCESKIEKPIPVGSYKPNQFGLFEMHGNVDELCVSCKGEENNTYSLEVPRFKFKNGELIYSDNICVSTHGGSYRLDAGAAKSNHSWDASQNYFSHDDVGFRLIKDNHFVLDNTSKNQESLKPLIQNGTFSNQIQGLILPEENAKRLAEENAKRINKIAALASYNDGTASALRKDFQATINHFT
jgi:formylglycine-generating enzyme required for sulfatase activity